MLDPLLLLALMAVGMLAGFVDAIAGGGGMITVPALISAGLPPVAALATNKLQSMVGTGMAVFTYWRRGFVALRELLPATALTFAGSVLGALAVSNVDVTLLNVAVPIALIGIALYFLFAPRLSDADRAARLPFVWLLAIHLEGGVFGAWLGELAYIALLGIAFVLRFRAGKWKTMQP